MRYSMISLLGGSTDVFCCSRQTPQGGRRPTVAGKTRGGRWPRPAGPSPTWSVANCGREGSRFKRFMTRWILKTSDLVPPRYGGDQLWPGRFEAEDIRDPLDHLKPWSPVYFFFSLPTSSYSYLLCFEIGGVSTDSGGPLSGFPSPQEPKEVRTPSRTIWVTGLELSL